MQPATGVQRLGPRRTPAAFETWKLHCDNWTVRLNWRAFSAMLLNEECMAALETGCCLCTVMPRVVGAKPAPLPPPSFQLPVVVDIGHSDGTCEFLQFDMG